MNIEAYTRTFLSVAFILSLTACAGFSERLSNVGKDPKMAAVENPVERPSYRPVSMPMPAAHSEAKQANSLWMSGRKGFFKDQRATAIGDILTVLVDIEDEATLENKTTKSRAATEELGVPNLLGFEQSVGRVLPDGYNPATAVGVDSATNNTGNGKIEREEEVDLKVAAVITQILPNGNMVIHGKQQVRVNNERRDLEVSGVIRPEDIDVTNSVTYEKIAEARIVYGGQGMLTDANRPRYGNEVMDVLLPF
jgi:flagellar L-ring protein precursor FlgH